MLKLTTIGNLGQDARIQETNTGRKAISFSIAQNKRWKDAQGIEHEQVQWINCTLWRNKEQSTEIANYLKKGIQVYVEGEPEAKIYTNSAGQASVDFRCTVNLIKLLGSKKEDGTQMPAEKKQETQKEENSILDDTQKSDDLPF